MRGDRYHERLSWAGRGSGASEARVGIGSGEMSYIQRTSGADPNE